MRLRKGTMQDVDGLAELYDELTDYLERHVNYPCWKKGEYPTRREAERGAAEGTLLVAEENGSLAGGLMLNHETVDAYRQVDWGAELDDGEVLILHTFAVRPAFSGRGVGERLLAYALGFAAGQGKRAVRLDVQKENTPAIHVYERAGFRRCGTVLIAYSEMERALPFCLYEKLL